MKLYNNLYLNLSEVGIYFLLSSFMEIFTEISHTYLLDIQLTQNISDVTLTALFL